MLIPYKYILIKQRSSSYHSIGVEVVLAEETKVITMKVLVYVMLKHMGNIVIG